MNNEELKLMAWSKNLAWDLGIEDELYSSNITSVFMNSSIILKDEPEIKKIVAYKNEFDRTTLAFIATGKFENKSIQLVIRIYSPLCPGTKDLNEYMGAKIVGLTPICTIENYETSVVTLIVKELKTIKSNGKKSNISIRDEDEKSKFLRDLMKYSHKNMYGELKLAQFNFKKLNTIDMIKYLKPYDKPETFIRGDFDNKGFSKY